MRHTRARDQKIYRALVGAAELVRLHGDDYLPHFESLEREWLAIEARNAARQRAATFAAASKDVFASH